MSRRKMAKAKAKRVSKARAAQAAKRQALAVKILPTAETPILRVRRSLVNRRVREGLLTLGAVAGVLCMLLAVASFAFDIKPVIFRSGSMSPAIGTGALAISHNVDAKDLAIGDIVTVKTDLGVRVTHRIKDLTIASGEASMVLKGDANKVPDDKIYVVPSADRVLFSIPKVGYVVSWLSGPIGIFAGGLLAGLLVLTAFGPGTRNQGKPRNQGTPPARGKPRIHGKPRTGRRFSVSVAAVTLGLASAGVAGTTSTQAYFTDSAAMTTGTFASGNWDVPVVVPSLGCQNTDGKNNSSSTSVTLSWPRNPAYSYRIVVTPQNSYGSPTLFGSSQTGSDMTTSISGSSFTAGGPYEAQIQAKLTTPINPSNSNWNTTGPTLKLTAGSAGNSGKLHCG